MRALIVVSCLACSVAPAQDGPVVITPMNSGVTASFRGLAVRGSKEAWVTGSAATVVRTQDAGQTWQKIAVPFEPVKGEDGKDVTMDFRDVELLPDGSVLLMSIGNGRASRLFRSADDGKTWDVVLENTDEKGFFDGMSFDATGKNGIMYGDPLLGRMDLYATKDAGRTWQHVPERNRPELKEGEYGFAASGSGAAIVGSNIWIGTGGSVARLHHSTDGGKTWAARKVPIRSGTSSAGIFSITFLNAEHGVMIGGDYLKPNEADNNVAVTLDGGRSWIKSDAVKMPHKACVVSVGGQRLLACGRTGVASSEDGGRTWKMVSKESYYTCGFDSKSQSGFLAGRDGRIARFSIVANQK